jgi:hypothetical protein
MISDSLDLGCIPLSQRDAGFLAGKLQVSPRTLAES